MVRKFTNQILEMIEDGILDKDTVILACLNYMSESEVQDMAECNEFLPTEDEDMAECNEFLPTEDEDSEDDCHD